MRSVMTDYLTRMNVSDVGGAVVCHAGRGPARVVSCCGTVRVAWQQRRVAARASGR